MSGFVVAWQAQPLDAPLNHHVGPLDIARTLLGPNLYTWPAAAQHVSARDQQTEQQLFEYLHYEQDLPVTRRMIHYGVMR